MLLLFGHVLRQRSFEEGVRSGLKSLTVLQTIKVRVVAFFSGTQSLKKGLSAAK